MRRQTKERQEKREDRPILKRLHATFLQLFRGTARQKMVCVRGIPRVTGTLCTSLSKKTGVNMCILGTNRKSVMMIRVKVHSKSELVEDREGKSVLYGVICCCGDRSLLRAVICGHTV